MEPVASKCVECGCVIHPEGLTQHTMWHEKLRRVIGDVEALATLEADELPPSSESDSVGAEAPGRADGAAT